MNIWPFNRKKKPERRSFLSGSSSSSFRSQTHVAADTTDHNTAAMAFLYGYAVGSPGADDCKEKAEQPEVPTHTYDAPTHPVESVDYGSSSGCSVDYGSSCSDSGGYSDSGSSDCGGCSSD